MHERFSGLILVGERRSSLAVEKGWSWQQCQHTGPRLCAIKLFSALEQSGYNPKEQIFLNVYHDDGRLNEPIVEMLRQIGNDNFRIVGMGQLVQEVLTRNNIPHLQIVHPAARGNWKKPGVYESHVVNVLG